jgi:Protein of unknown function (DUF3307)
MHELAHPQTLAQGMQLFFALLIGHALADYPLQGEFLALHKNRHYKDNSRTMPPGLWVHCLAAHCLIQAGFVWVITGRFIFAMIEFVVHLVLDFIKCENISGYHTDQLLHCATKAIFVTALLQGWVS